MRRAVVGRPNFGSGVRTSREDIPSLIAPSDGVSCGNSVMVPQVSSNLPKMSSNLPRCPHTSPKCPQTKFWPTLRGSYVDSTRILARYSTVLIHAPDVLSMNAKYRSFSIKESARPPVFGLSTMNTQKPYPSSTCKNHWHCTSSHTNSNTHVNQPPLSNKPSERSTTLLIPLATN